MGEAPCVTTRRVRRLPPAPAAEGVTWRQVNAYLSPPVTIALRLQGNSSQCYRQRVAPSWWPPGLFPLLRSEDGRKRFRQTLPEKVVLPLRTEISAPWKRRAGKGGEDCLCLLPGPAEIVV